jgi:hypothetical protein
MCRGSVCVEKTDMKLCSPPPQKKIKPPLPTPLQDGRLELFTVIGTMPVSPEPATLSCRHQRQ